MSYDFEHMIVGAAENGRLKFRVAELEQALAESIVQTVKWTEQFNQATVRNNQKANEVQRLQEQVRVLRDMAIITRTGVLLMVPEPQKSGFLKIISEALAQTAPGEPEWNVQHD